MSALLALLTLVAATSASAQVERTLVLSDKPAVVEMRAAALIMSGQQGGVLPIAIATVPDGKPCDDGIADCRFTALIEIDGAALLEAVSPPPPTGETDAIDAKQIKIFAYVLGTELDVLEQQTMAIDLDLPSHRNLLTNTGLKAFLRLEVPPGNHVLRVLAHAGEAFGLRGLDLHVGPPAAGSLTIGSPTTDTATAETPATDTPNAPQPPTPVPIFHELTKPWLLAAPADVEIPLPAPFGLDTTSPLPAARPQMPAGGSLSGQVFIAEAATAGPGDTQELIALLRLSGGGQTAGEQVEVPLTIHDRKIDAGMASIAVSFTAPPTVGSGLWEIAVGDKATVDGKVGGHSDFVPIFIEGSSSTQAAIDKEERSAPRTGGRSKSQTKARRQLIKATKAGYLRVLRQLAQGQVQTAKSTLMASEESVVRALDGDAVDALSQAESQVLASLPNADWDCLLPVILLHLDLSQTYRENDQRILALHATRMTIDLAEAYAQKLTDPGAKAEAAQALSSLASYSQHSGGLSQAERIFTRALELSADATALLGLATIYEKRGLFDRALPVFERLVAKRPEHAESALRLALNLARTGRTDVAQKALSRLTARHENDWITLLAYEELARLLTDDDKRQQAADILRQGLGRWPAHPTLQLQLAWVLDAQGKSDASLALLDNLGAGGAHKAAERSRYNRWSRDLLDATRRTLATTAEARQVDLEQWLSSQSMAGGG